MNQFNYLWTLTKLEEELKKNPNNAENYLALGKLYYTARKAEQAIKILQKFIDLKSDHYIGYMMMGRALKYLGRMDDAILNFKQAIKLKPDLAEGHNVLGVTLQ